MDEFDSRLNIIVGPNAVGKTSVLEALSLSTNLKSFRTHQLKELIKSDETEAMISAQFELPTVSKVQIAFQGSRRMIRIDEKAISTRSKFPFLGGSISFSPDDLLLIKASPDGRRDFLDELAVSQDPEFILALQKFEKSLKQRNAVLKLIKNSEAGEDQLEIWTENFISSAIPIYRERLKIVQKLNSELSTTYQQVFNVHEKIVINYLHRFEERLTDDAQSVEDLLRKKLLIYREIEKASGHSLVGPHKDDFDIAIDGMSARSFGSQGQTRGLVIALKILQLELTREKRQMSPILLLDDIISELDDLRVQALIRYLAHYPGQMFVTTAEINKVKALHSEFSNFKVIDMKEHISEALGSLGVAL